MRWEVRVISIRKKRLDAGLTQKQLAKLVGVDQSAVTQWEKGIGPKRVRLNELAAALDCTVEELLEPDEEEQHG